ncbi:hypothetical protein IV58_GL001334 [Lactobacillus delbrueckii subsp. jakobsenii ZN7a-9 = DSM 26046]|nr:hypothetical protein IV58_GL001334 [Lactobacillus delbrueckii subsp. jakobsenii ZN7a-9 = DSM 26046]
MPRVITAPVSTPLSSPSHYSHKAAAFASFSALGLFPFSSSCPSLSIKAYFTLVPPMSKTKYCVFFYPHIQKSIYNY